MTQLGIPFDGYIFRNERTRRAWERILNHDSAIERDYFSCHEGRIYFRMDTSDSDSREQQENYHQALEILESIGLTFIEPLIEHDCISGDVDMLPTREEVVAPPSEEERQKNGVLRVVVCAAFRNHDGLIIASPRHFDKVCHAQIKALKEAGHDIKPSMDGQGFVDQFGEFMTREEALEVAKKAGQLDRFRRYDGLDILLSEHLY